MTFHAKFMTAAATAAIALGAPAALAQTNGPAANIDVSNLMELDDDNTQVRHEGMTVDELEELHIYTEADQEVGEVEEVLGTSEGQVAALVVDIEGGFSGIFDDEEVIVPIDHLTYDQQQNRFTTDLTEADLETLPRWDD